MIFVIQKITLQQQKQISARHWDATVTNDGATILKSVWIDNPAARHRTGERWRLWVKNFDNLRLSVTRISTNWEYDIN